MSAQQALPGAEDAIARDPLDFNRTPAWVVLRQAWPEARIVGNEIDVRRSGLAWDSGVYEEVYLGDWTAEFSTTAGHFGHRPDLIISNPLFGLTALAFLQRAVERVAPGGTVAFLLPIHWDADADVESGFARQRFFDSLRLPDGREGYAKLTIVGGGPYPARPSFKKGGTASDRYAWFLFGERWAGHPGRRLHAIPPEEPTGQLELLGGGT